MNSPTIEPETISINYQWVKRPVVIAMTIFVGVLLYSIYTLANPYHATWQSDVPIDWGFSLKHFFVEVYLVELISGFLIFYGLFYYANFFRIDRLRLDIVSILLYNLRFLPFFLFIFFLINPFTQTARYWLQHFPDWHPDIYYQYYSYSLQLYLLYLVPILLMGYGIINLNWVRQVRSEGKYIRKIKVMNATGETYLPLKEVVWFEVRDRKYFAKTEAQEYRIGKNLSSLEKVLAPEQFFRINRAIIANLQWISHYAFWENEKYILTMKDKERTTFIMTRKRLQRLRQRMQLN